MTDKGGLPPGSFGPELQASVSGRPHFRGRIVRRVSHRRSPRRLMPTRLRDRRVPAGGHPL